MEGFPDKRIKVALVINGFLIGGAQNVLLQIIKRIDYTRFDIVLVTLIRNNEDEKRYLYDKLPEGTKVYDLRFHGFYDLRAWGTLWRALRESKPEVVFANLFFSHTVIRLLKPFFGYKVITAEHNTYFDKTWLQKVVDRILATLTYRIVAVSKTVARFTSNQEHIPLSKFFINYGGIDIRALQKEMDESDPTETCKQTGFTTHNKIILSVARVVPQKNHRLMLEGFAIFAPKHPEYRLLVIGGGNLIADMEAYSNELGIGDKVRFMGYQKQMYPFFRIADFFVSTSLIEGFGTTHAEALAAGLPLVSTKTAGPDEMIKEGVNGFFITEYTPEAVAGSLAKMAAQNIAPMREASRLSAEAYAMERMIETYEKLFTEAEQHKSRFIEFYYKMFRAIGTANWIRWGLRYRLFQYLKRVNYEFVVPFFGRVYRGNFDNIIDRRVYFYGAHEREVLLFMGTKISPESIVLDIGANIGHHSLFFSTKAKEVHAFEPSPQYHDRFESLMKENGITNVFLHRTGLGEIKKNAIYYASTGDTQGVGSFVEGHWPTNEEMGTLTIEKGDDVVSSLGLSRVDFIKIDVERYEQFVLQGLQETLKKFRPVIILEYSKQDFGSVETFRSLTAGYEPYELKINKPFLFFFNDPTCRVSPFDKEKTGKSEVLLLPTLS